MRRFLPLVVLVLAVGPFAVAQAADEQLSATDAVICHKTSSKSRPYQRLSVSGARLRAHQRHADDIIPASGSCPRTLLTPTTGGVAIAVNLLGVTEQPEPADPDGSGAATIRLRAGQGRVCFILTARDITLPATGAHIHRGTVEESGPVIVPLATPNAQGSSRGCVAASRTLVAQLLRNRAGFYVNVHSTDFPNGAIRGQLALPATTSLLRSSMTGAAERPTPGDADGTGGGAFALYPDKGRLCYTLAVRNIVLPATGAHIHRGMAEQAGPIVVPFQAPGASGTSSGCLTVDAALVREIAQNPGGFYSNVHTSDFPAGAVRGQLTSGS